MNIKIYPILFCFILTLGYSNFLLANISGARNVVVDTVNGIYGDISTQHDSELALRESVHQSVRQHLKPVLNFDKFTKLILAAHWKKTSIQQRQQLAEILQNFLFRTLTKAIVDNKQILLSYKEGLVVKEPKPGRTEDRAIVSVVVNTQSQGTVNLDFRMGRENGRWAAYDVIVQGVSFAINYRAILNSEIKKHGIDKVITTFLEQLETSAN